MRSRLYYATLFVIVPHAVVGLVQQTLCDPRSQPPFVQLADGSCADCTIKLINMSDRSRRLAVEVSGLRGAHLQAPALDQQGRREAEAAADAVTNLRVHVAAAGLTGAHEIIFTIETSIAVKPQQPLSVCCGRRAMSFVLRGWHVLAAAFFGVIIAVNTAFITVVRSFPVRRSYTQGLSYNERSRPAGQGDSGGRSAPHWGKSRHRGGCGPAGCGD